MIDPIQLNEKNMYRSYNIFICPTTTKTVKRITTNIRIGETNMVVSVKARRYRSNGCVQCS